MHPIKTFFFGRVYKKCTPFFISNIKIVVSIISKSVPRTLYKWLLLRHVVLLIFLLKACVHVLTPPPFLITVIPEYNTWRSQCAVEWSFLFFKYIVIGSRYHIKKSCNQVTSILNSRITQTCSSIATSRDIIDFIFFA